MGSKHITSLLIGCQGTIDHRRFSTTLLLTVWIQFARCVSYALNVLHTSVHWCSRCAVKLASIFMQLAKPKVDSAYACCIFCLVAVSHTFYVPKETRYLFWQDNSKNQWRSARSAWCFGWLNDERLLFAQQLFIISFISAVCVQSSLSLTISIRRPCRFFTCCFPVTQIIARNQIAQCSLHKSNMQAWKSQYTTPLQTNQHYHADT